MFINNRPKNLTRIIVAFLLIDVFYIGIFYVNEITYAVADYAQTYSTGNRTATMTLTKSGGWTGTLSTLVNGNTGDCSVAGSGGVDDTDWLQFQLLSGGATFIEAKFYQSNTDSHGVHQWQGSNDGVAWTSIGSSFTLGGVAPKPLQSCLETQRRIPIIGYWG